MSWALHKRPGGLLRSPGGLLHKPPRGPSPETLIFQRDFVLRNQLKPSPALPPPFASILRLPVVESHRASAGMHASEPALPPREPPGLLSTPSSPREACRTPTKHPGAPRTPPEPRQEVPDTPPGAPQDAPGAPQEAPRKAPDPREEVPRRPPGGPQTPQELGESPASQPPALLSAEAGSRSVYNY